MMSSDLPPVGFSPNEIRVLHVDDDLELADIVATFLEREYECFDIETVPNAEDALHRLSGATFDCIISDYSMPGRNGIELLEAVRAEYPDLPFILYTAKSAETIASEALSAGATDYFQKKVGPDQYQLLANRVRTAVEHRNAKEAYREIVPNLPGGIVIHDPETGEFTDLNAEFASMFGYGREELLAAGFETILSDEPPFTGEQARGHIHETVTRGPHNLEWLGVTTENDRLWVDVYLTSVRMRGTERVLAVVRDITHHKEREQRLKTLNDVTNNLLHTESRKHVAESGVTAARDVLRCETNAVHLFDDEESGLAPVAQTKRMADIVPDPPTFTGEDSIAWRVYQQGESLALTDIHEDPDIHNPNTDLQSELYLPLGDHGILIASSETLGAFDQQDVLFGEILADTITAALGHVDRTERLRSREQELDAANTLLTTLFETLPVGVTILDADGTIAQANQCAEEVLGLTEPEMTGLTYDDPEWEIIDKDGEPIPDDDLPFARVRETGEPVHGYEHGIRWPDGEERYLSVSATPLTADPETTEQVVTVISDITEQRNREESLRQQKERLAEFASVVSHDLRNPLSLIEGRLELARNEADNDHLAVIEDALDRMNRIIDDMLWLAHEGQEIGETEAVTVQSVAEAAWTITANDREGAELIFADSGPETTDSVRADEDRLMQLLENLFRNALDHCGPDVTVRFEMTDTGFVVEDDGPGIPEEVRDRIFESGYSTARGGTGFGLRIVKQVADAHDWEISVADGSKQGARFEITGVEFTE